MGFEEWLQGREMQVELNQQLNQLEQTRLLAEQNRLLAQQRSAQSNNTKTSIKCPYCASEVNDGAALCPNCKIPFFGLDLRALAYSVQRNPALVLQENLNLATLSAALEADRQEFSQTEWTGKFYCQSVPDGSKGFEVDELLVAPGAAVEAGTPLARVHVYESDGESTTVDAPVSGTVTKIFGYPGSRIIVGTLIAIIE